MTAEHTAHETTGDLPDGVLSIGEIIEEAGVRQVVALGRQEVWSRTRPRRRCEAQAGAALARLRQELLARGGAR